MTSVLGRLGDRLLAMVVPQKSAAAVECYYIYKCIYPIRLRARCCDGSCGKYEIISENGC
ncbi:hypothetical protein ABGB14_38385 [Nonomuraea sp. B10E15]|uniref:hypothetical protein n=1 Tax=Nonomuraea sp. B10E15 TaxID=3153560 RepID=UPI00325D0045